MRFVLRLYYPDDTDLIMLRERLGSDFPAQVVHVCVLICRGFLIKSTAALRGGFILMLRKMPLSQSGFLRLGIRR